MNVSFTLTVNPDTNVRQRTFRLLGHTYTILRAPEYATSQERGMFINLGRWCNQPAIFKKKSFREFCELIGPDSAAMRYMREYEREHPEIAKTYYDMRFERLSQGQ